MDGLCFNTLFINIAKFTVICLLQINWPNWDPCPRTYSIRCQSKLQSYCWRTSVIRKNNAQYSKHIYINNITVFKVRYNYTLNTVISRPTAKKLLYQRFFLMYLYFSEVILFNCIHKYEALHIRRRKSCEIYCHTWKSHFCLPLKSWSIDWWEKTINKNQDFDVFFFFMID